MDLVRLQKIAYKKFEKGIIAYNRLKYSVTIKFDGFEKEIPSMDAIFIDFQGNNKLPK